MNHQKTKRCGRKNCRGLWECRVCGRFTCEHLCTAKVFAEATEAAAKVKTAVCSRCHVETGRLGFSKGIAR